MDGGGHGQTKSDRNRTRRKNGPINKDQIPGKNFHSINVAPSTTGYGVPLMHPDGQTSFSHIRSFLLHFKSSPNLHLSRLKQLLIRVFNKNLHEKEETIAVCCKGNSSAFICTRNHIFTWST
jgi:hypothetical protein